MIQLLGQISSFVWGPLFLVPLLLLTGLYLTIRLKGLQFRELWHSLWLALIVRKEHGAEGDISHFQALMTALAATVGTGNIVGVATAIAAGGPGALFWMWVTGLVGMATKYSEALLSVHFRTVDERGEQIGGPMYYLERGVGGPVGKVLGVAFALFASVAAFGIGNMVQSQAVSDAISNSAQTFGFSIHPGVVGFVVAVLAALVILGGIKSIGKFTGTFVPLMIVLYMGGASVILILNYQGIPDALALVFQSAFSGTAATGGFLGAGVAAAIRFGVARGIFSNESGLGSAGIAAAAAQTREPVRQALVSMTQTFIDTLVVCSFTGLAIISTGAWSQGLDGAGMTQAAFRTGLPGEWGGLIVAVSLTLFAFSTMLGWAYYGEKSLEYLAGVKAVTPYRLVFVTAIFVGSLGTIDFVWLLSDILNGLMALPNLIGLILLAGVIVKETRSYFQRVGRLSDLESARGG
ncbi:MAG: sodium:alanine symporter family protein [Gemmatimonadetes bacterium]|nr:sodium:alanine symporter family protein [Gemmatimonadota bacterium]